MSRSTSGSYAKPQRPLATRAKVMTARRPVEAAWLASLLRNPDAALAQMVRTGEVDVRRVGAILDGLRPMPPARRLAAQHALDTWRPDWLGALQPSPPAIHAPAPEPTDATAPRWHGAPDAGPGEAPADAADGGDEADASIALPRLLWPSPR